MLLGQSWDKTNKIRQAVFILTKECPILSFLNLYFDSAFNPLDYSYLNQPELFKKFQRFKGIQLEKCLITILNI
jgi:hypothetical protein